MKKITVLILSFLFSLSVIGQDTATIKPAAIAFKMGLFNFKKTPITDNATEKVLQGGLQYFKGDRKSTRLNSSH